MARIDRLPPPPAIPVRSPPVAVKGEDEVRIPGLGAGPSLEARVHAPPTARRVVVLCHPHPLYGGSMHSPVPLALAKVMADVAGEQLAWLRFNYRGVGESDGSYDEGRGEVDDALAALRYVRGVAPSLAVTLCGHSFGSAVALRAAARHEAEVVDRVLLIAPSARLFGFTDVERARPATTIFIGDRDEFCDVDEARTFALDLGADFRVFEGFDHHFLKSRRAMAEAALPVIAPEVSSP